MSKNSIEVKMKADEIFKALNDHWENIAINIFEWHGLDEISDSLTSELIEKYLYENGQAVFFKDSNGYLCLPSSDAGGYNTYDQPIKVRALGRNYNKQVNLGVNGILIKDNPLRESTMKVVKLYTKKMSDIEMTKDIHRNAHKTPIMIESSNDASLTAKNIFNQIDSNEPVIFKNRARSSEEIGITVLNTNVPYINDVLEDDYHNYEARILNILGLDNFVEDKKERVQSAEVESNNEYNISSFRVRLEQRKKACEKINKLFGLHLSVEYVKGEQIETDEKVENENMEEEVDG